MSETNFNCRRVFFDTNVILDAVNPKRPQCAEARAALDHCNGGGDMGLVAPMSLKDAYYVLCKMYGEKKARDLIGHLMDLLVIAPFGAEECDLALKSDEPDFEDGLIRACAELNEAKIILTRDVKAYKNSLVKAMTCAEYLELCK